MAWLVLTFLAYIIGSGRLGLYAGFLSPNASGASSSTDGGQGTGQGTGNPSTFGSLLGADPTKIFGGANPGGIGSQIGTNSGPGDVIGGFNFGSGQSNQSQPLIGAGGLATGGQDQATTNTSGNNVTDFFNRLFGTNVGLF